MGDQLPGGTPVTDGPAYTYASDQAVERPDGSLATRAVFVAFCPEHIHIIAMPRQRYAAPRIAEAHNRVHHPRWEVAPRRPHVGRLDYFDLNINQRREVS